MRELGAVIRNQVPCLRESVLEAYGDILHRAWREAAGACALETEQLIQVLPCVIDAQGTACFHVAQPAVAQRYTQALTRPVPHSCCETPWPSEIVVALLRIWIQSK